jgi:hypothetical protein
VVGVRASNTAAGTASSVALREVREVREVPEVPEVRLMRTLLQWGASLFAMSNSSRVVGRTVESNPLRVNGPRSHSKLFGSRGMVGCGARDVC